MTALDVRLKGKRILLHGKFQAIARERLAESILAQRGTLAEELDSSVNYVVVPDPAISGTLAKKVTSMRGKGAPTEILPVEAFDKLIAPTSEDLKALMRQGAQGAQTLVMIGGSADYYAKFSELYGQTPPSPKAVFQGESFDGLNLSNFDFSGVTFEACSFQRTKLDGAIFSHTHECDFSGASGESVRFGRINKSRFVGAKLPRASIVSHLAGSDFTKASLEAATFSEHFWASRVNPQPSAVGPIFAQADLRRALFDGNVIEGANFDGADLTDAAFKGPHCNRSSFRGACLQRTLLVGGRCLSCDFSKANLTGANLAETDLTGATLEDTDVAGCNLRGCKGADFSKSRHFDPGETATATPGKALAELDAAANDTRELKINFLVERDGERSELQITCYGGKRRGGNSAHLWLPALHDRLQPQPLGGQTLEKEMQQVARVFGHQRVVFETVMVKADQSPTGAKEFRTLAQRALAEAFGQPMPPPDEKIEQAHRALLKQREAQAKAERAAAKHAAAQEAGARKANLVRNIQKTVGAITDVPTFLAALAIRIDKPKIAKAVSMLKSAKFQLFTDITPAHVQGVVKSQTDPDLVYACRIDKNGHYACCTQNLNICGGLRGSICKHLLVLIIGLVKAGQLDPPTIDGWVALTHGVKPELDRDKLGEIILKYKGAEAGEIDWRPTETLPEDYYAL